ncbi:hypothetical protein [Pedococcus bigeumensis]|uniref:hypothetical protein n=1 Tax=Pedococcus bigeumensis TaxID=433644 RepID=UPI002FED6855
MTTWHQPTPGPIATLTPPTQMRELVRNLRTHAARHDDTAWLHPAPNAERRPIPSLSQDLLDAIGVVGLATPRSVGESHLLRPLTHLIHGPVRHLLIDDVALLPTYALDELHQCALIARTQLWLVLDTGDQPPARGTGRTRHQHAADILEWVTATSTTLAPDQLLTTWAARPQATPQCETRSQTWWYAPLPPGPAPVACLDHEATANDTTSTPRITCLLAGMRRALTGGTVAPATARQRLIELTDHPDITVADRWALAAAGRDLYTPGIDALTQTHPGSHRVALRDVAPDATTIHVRGTARPVGPMRRPALARLRTSRQLAGALPAEPIDGIFHLEPGVRPSRTRR